MTSFKAAFDAISRSHFFFRKKTNDSYPYGYGDVVIVPFPFSNQEKVKQRPAVVVSTSAFSSLKKEVIIIAITSKLHPKDKLGEFKIVHWQKAGLMKASTAKALITTIEENLIIKKLGKLEASDRYALETMLKRMINFGQI